MQGEEEHATPDPMMNTHHSFGEIIRTADPSPVPDLGQSASQEALLAAGKESAGFGRNEFGQDHERAQIQGDGVTPPSQERESHFSYGTGSFTTNTFNAKLAGSEGMKILKYIQDEDFGKYGESIKLIDNIQVSEPLVTAIYESTLSISLGIHCEAHP